MTTLTTAHERERVIRPAAVLPERAAREILAWLQTHDVSQGGCWSSAVGTIQRYSGPFNGPSGMRGDAKYSVLCDGDGSGSAAGLGTGSGEARLEALRFA